MRENFTVTFSDVKPLNKELSSCKVWVMSPGLNANKSDIPKNVVEAAVPSIFGIPIIGEFIESKNDFGSHGGKIVIEGNNISYIRTTQAYGFVPENAEITWETSDIDGKEYLCTTGVLWTSRWPECQLAIDNNLPQSMEVEFTKSFFNEKTGINEVQEMNFSALCILGENVTPAFAGAQITSNFADYRDEIIKQMKELMFEFSKINSEGGEKLENENVTKEDLTSTMENQNENFSLSSEQLEGELRRIVSQAETFEDPFWGWTEQRYYYIDSQDDVVVVQDCKLGGVVGFKFTVTGDLVSVDFDSGLRYKIDWVPMDVNNKPDGDENSSNASDGDEFSLMPKERMNAITEQFNKVKEEKDKLLSDGEQSKSQFEELNAKFEETSAKFEEVSNEVTDLRQFKLEKESAEREQKVNDVLAKFASHLTEDEIETFKSNANEISLEDMETQLFALIGRKMSSENFSLKNEKTLRVPLFAQEELTKQVKKSSKPYADLIENNRIVGE